ncbi:MAG: aminoglycoside phosphotransferase family protein [Oscillospiraceae bacterium]|nr:aminoglycoside phosphotransferase family protein [Oscillospiraceae bacterium]
MHKMYSLFTEKGKYAVKLLNPYVMQRETAMENYRMAESLERKLEENNIPILPAMILGGKKMQQTDGQFFYLFKWYDGKALKSEEIQKYHCEKIGALLAQIHKIDRKEAPYNKDKISVDWDSYIKQLEHKNRELHHLLRDNRTLLYESQAIGNEAMKKIPSVISICHNDMDSKNVLWSGNDCLIIDLECLSYSSPIMESYELALCWSGYEKCSIDFEMFGSFIYSYAKAGGELPSDWETVYNSNQGRLEWLEYNVKRSLGIECSEDEIEMGISEVKDTMAHVIYYHEAKTDMLNCLRQIAY